MKVVETDIVGNHSHKYVAKCRVDVWKWTNIFWCLHLPVIEIDDEKGQGQQFVESNNTHDLSRTRQSSVVQQCIGWSEIISRLPPTLFLIGGVISDHSYYVSNL